MKSYLDDQQPLQGHPFQGEGVDQADSGLTASQPDIGLKVSPAPGPSGSGQEPRRQASRSPVPPPASDPGIGGRKSKSPLPPTRGQATSQAQLPVKQQPQHKTSSAGSAVLGKKQMSPQEFLSRIQDFVQKAEVTDPQYSQPVWPAIVQSPDIPGKQQQQQRQPPLSLSPTSSTAPALAPSPLPPSSPTTKQTLSPDMVPELGTYSNTGRRPSDTYSPKQREHSPYRPDIPNIFDSSLGQRQIPIPSDLDANQIAEKDLNMASPFNLHQGAHSPTHRPHSPTAAAAAPPHHPAKRIAPSPGKSYLDKATASNDPFGARSLELDPNEPPPSASTAAATSSSILANLRQQQNQREFEDNQQDNLNYRSLPADFRNKGKGLAPVPSPRRGRSPRLPVQEPMMSSTRAAADRHIPNVLTPDPLTAQPAQLALAQDEGDGAPSIKDTDLYRRLQEGLSNIDKLVQSETFKRELARSGSDFQRYSHHLGRAEFGVLKKRNSFQGTGSMNPMIGRGRGGYGTGSQQASRDPSNERPASAMARFGQHGRSAQPSRDSSIGIHESR